MTGTHRWTRLSAILLTLAVLLTACGGNDETAEDTTTTTERAPTTEPEAATSTTEPADEPPELENTGEDFVAIMQSINDYENWLFQHPDPALLVNYTLEDCTCYEEEQAKLEDLATKGWKARSNQGRYTNIEVVDQQTPDTVTVRALFESLDAAFVDSDDQIVQDFDLPPAGRVLVSLTRIDERWRVGSYTFLGPQ